MNCNVHVFDSLIFSNKFGFILETVFSYSMHKMFMKLSTGRQVTAFLFLYNIAQWLVISFEIQKVSSMWDPTGTEAKFETFNVVSFECVEIFSEVPLELWNISLDISIPLWGGK